MAASALYKAGAPGSHVQTIQKLVPQKVFLGWVHLYRDWGRDWRCGHSNTAVWRARAERVQPCHTRVGTTTPAASSQPNERAKDQHNRSSEYAQRMMQHATLCIFERPAKWADPRVRVRFGTCPLSIHDYLETYRQRGATSLTSDFSVRDAYNNPLWKRAQGASPLFLHDISNYVTSKIACRLLLDPQNLLVPGLLL